MPRSRVAGSSLVEVMIGIVLVTTGFLGLATLSISNDRSQEDAAEEAQVRNHLRNLAERVRSSPFSEVVSDYQGFSTSLTGLSSGTGTVTIFVDETESSAEAAALGLPRDLDGDDAATNTDVSTNYQLLPVMLELDWDGRTGPRTRKFFFFISAED